MDLEGMDQRFPALRNRAGNIVGLGGAKPGIRDVTEFTPPAAPTPGVPSGPTLHKFDMEKRKLDKLLDNISAFDVSANGEKALYRQGPNWFIASTATLGQPAPAGAPRAPNMLKTSDIAA